MILWAKERDSGCLHPCKIFLDLDLKSILLFLQCKKCLIYAASLKSKVSNLSNYIHLPLQLRGYAELTMNQIILLKVKITAVTDESIGLKVCVMCGGFKQKDTTVTDTALTPFTDYFCNTANKDHAKCCCTPTWPAGIIWLAYLLFSGKVLLKIKQIVFFYSKSLLNML